MKWFLIEEFNLVTFEVHMVKCKDYSEACLKLQKLHGETTYKLLGIYEATELDKNVLKRVA